MSADADWVLRRPLQVDTDVFTARRDARELGRVLGLEPTDQIRLATVLSELGRTLVTASVPAMACFTVEAKRLNLILVSATVDPLTLPSAGVWALRSVRGLVTEAEYEPATGIRLAMTLPAEPSPEVVRQLRTHFAKSSAGEASALDELRAQNLDLLRTLEELTAKQDELVTLNEELAETNRGVMAMYTELSEELEQTNQGVLALYTELDERGEQLRLASTAKSRFLASVSHEMRSPLNSMLAVVDLLLDPDSDPLSDDQIRQLEMIGESGRQELDLINDVLDHARAEAGALVPALEPVRLETVLDPLLSALQPLGKPGVQLRFEVDPAVPALYSDPKLLAHLLRNLVGNALHFTPQGEVRLTARMERDRLVLAVADTGIGIPPEHQERIFEEFFQVPGPWQVGRRGTGLGLAYARRIAVALGGTLTLSSDQHGSTFTVNLPANVPDSGPEGAQV